QHVEAQLSSTHDRYQQRCGELRATGGRMSGAQLVHHHGALIVNHVESPSLGHRPTHDRRRVMRQVRHASFLSIIVALVMATAAHAVLAPTKASQLVTLYASGLVCPLPGSNPASAFYDEMVRADGSITPFVIPPKQVFIL